MSLIQQRIASLLNGVSQRPQEQRHSSEADIQLNALSHPVRGLMKRPPFEFLAKLAGVSNDFSDAFCHEVNRDESEKYHVVISNGDIHVFDALTGEELNVFDLTPSALVSVSDAPDGYLVDDVSAGFRAATAGDTTIVTNRGIATKRGTKKTPLKPFDSLIYIRQADYGTTYRVTINGVSVAIQTVTGDTAAARPDISTEKVAADLLSALIAETQLSDFVFTQIGSTISIANLNAQDYSLLVEDGLADQGLRAVKGSIQAFEDLPRRAPNGFVVEIAGDPASSLDNYWVRFDDTKGPDQTGVWIECAAPGTIVTFDPATLPHRLVRQGEILGLTRHVGLNNNAGAKIVLISGASKIPWTFLEPGDVSAPATVWEQRLLVRDNDAGVKVTLAANYSKLTFPFAIDTSVVEGWNNSSVSLYKNSVLVDTKVFKPGSSLPGTTDRAVDAAQAVVNSLTAQIASAVSKRNSAPDIFKPIYTALIAKLNGQLDQAQAALILLQQKANSHDFSTSFVLDTDVSGNLPGESGDVFELILTYTVGSAMNTEARHEFRKATLAPKTIYGVLVPTKQIIFNEALEYPPGSEVLVTINGTDYTYTVGNVAEDAATVGFGVNAVIQAESSITASLDASSNTKVNIFNDDASIPDLTVFVGLDSSSTFSNPDLSMVTNVFAGFTLKNITDGSEGLIDSNTASTIKLVGQGPSSDVFLSGGVDNVFSPGDLCTVVGTGRYFIWEQCPWKERGAGDLTVGPFPSFIDATISDVAFYQNRLVLASRENLIFSAAGDLFNFFRFSGAQLLGSDLIDVKAAHREVALFHSLALWNESLYAISESAEFLVSGDPVLTPTSVRIDVAGHVPNRKGARPLPQGNRLYLTRHKGGFTQVPELYASDSSPALLNSNDLNIDTPKYLRGSPIDTKGDDGLGLLFVLTDEGDTIYVYKYVIDPQGNRVQSSWSQWTLATGTIVGLSFVDGSLAALVQEADGFYLYRADLNVVLDSLNDSDEAVSALDRRVENTSSGFDATVSGTVTSITLPYAIKTDGSDGTVVVVDRDTATVYYPVFNVVRSTVIEVEDVDLTAANIYVGVLYEFRYVLSRLYWREPQTEKPEVGGRLGLRYLDVFYHDTTDFVVRVSLTGRPQSDFPVQLLAAGSGKRRFPILGRNEYATIELRSFSPGTCAFSMLDWEGDFTLRSKRV